MTRPFVEKTNSGSVAPALFQVVALSHVVLLASCHHQGIFGLLPTEQPHGAIIKTIRRAENKKGHHYVVTQESNNVCHINDDDLVGNILCG